MMPDTEEENYEKLNVKLYRVLLFQGRRRKFIVKAAHNMSLGKTQNNIWEGKKKQIKFLLNINIQEAFRVKLS